MKDLAPKVQEADNSTRKKRVKQDYELQTDSDTEDD